MTVTSTHVRIRKNSGGIPLVQTEKPYVADLDFQEATFQKVLSPELAVDGSPPKRYSDPVTYPVASITLVETPVSERSGTEVCARMRLAMATRGCPVWTDPMTGSRHPMVTGDRITLEFPDYRLWATVVGTPLPVPAGPDGVKGSFVVFAEIEI
jgi:hypothetical protein